MDDHSIQQLVENESSSQQPVRHSIVTPGRMLVPMVAGLCLLNAGVFVDNVIQSLRKSNTTLAGILPENGIGTGAYAQDTFLSEAAAQTTLDAKFGMLENSGTIVDFDSNAIVSYIDSQGVRQDITVDIQYLSPTGGLQIVTYLGPGATASDIAAVQEAAAFNNQQLVLILPTAEVSTLEEGIDSAFSPVTAPTLVAEDVVAGAESFDVTLRQVNGVTAYDLFVVKQGTDFKNQGVRHSVPDLTKKVPVEDLDSDSSYNLFYRAVSTDPQGATTRSRFSSIITASPNAAEPTTTTTTVPTTTVPPSSDGGGGDTGGSCFTATHYFGEEHSALGPLYALKEALRQTPRGEKFIADYKSFHRKSIFNRIS